jgi:hypothetical protein
MYGIEIPVIEEEKPGQQKGVQNEKPKQPMKNDAKMFYDKEDLISFHQIFISKPLVKACHDLDYEHPTVI